MVFLWILPYMPMTQYHRLYRIIWGCVMTRYIMLSFSASRRRARMQSS